MLHIQLKRASTATRNNRLGRLFQLPDRTDSSLDVRLLYRNRRLAAFIRKYDAVHLLHPGVPFKIGRKQEHVLAVVGRGIVR